MKRIVILIIVLFLVSCTTPRDSTSLTNKDYQVGTEGLVFDFISNAPPPSVYEGNDFEVALDVKNQGAYDAKGMITLSIEDTYMKLKKGSKSLELKDMFGKAPATPAGGYDIYEWDITAKSIDELSESHDTLIVATACYEYKTQLFESVCLDADPLNQKAVAQACDAKTHEFEGQGAPVAITKLEPIPAQETKEGRLVSKPHFLVYVENKGKGKVIHQEKKDDFCTGKDIGKADFNALHLDKLVFGNGDYYYEFLDEGEEGDNTMNCLPNPLILREGENFFRCTLDNDVEELVITDSYETQIAIELRYGYTESKSTIVTNAKTTTY